MSEPISTETDIEQLKRDLTRSSLFKKQQTTDKKLQFEVRSWPYCLHRDPQKVEGPALDRGWPCHHRQRQGRCHRGDDGV